MIELPPNSHTHSRGIGTHIREITYYGIKVTNNFPNLSQTKISSIYKAQFQPIFVTKPKITKSLL